MKKITIVLLGGTFLLLVAYAERAIRLNRYGVIMSEVFLDPYTVIVRRIPTEFSILLPVLDRRGITGSDVIDIRRQDRILMNGYRIPWDIPFDPYQGTIERSDTNTICVRMSGRLFEITVSSGERLWSIDKEK